MSSIWESLYGPEGQFSQGKTGVLLGATQTSPQPSKDTTMHKIGYAVLGLGLVALIVLGVYYGVRAYKKKQDEKKMTPTNPASANGSAMLGATNGGANGSMPLSPYYPPVVPSTSQRNVPGIPQQDPGNENSASAWWHNVDMYDQISQTAISPFSGWYPAAPQPAGVNRGDYYRGYGWWNSGPYESGYLTYPSNFIPLSTTQVSVTDLHPFCSKQR